MLFCIDSKDMLIYIIKVYVCALFEILDIRSKLCVHFLYYHYICCISIFILFIISVLSIRTTRRLACFLEWGIIFNKNKPWCLLEMKTTCNTYQCDFNVYCIFFFFFLKVLNKDVAKIPKKWMLKWLFTFICNNFCC